MVRVAPFFFDSRCICPHAAMQSGQKKANLTQTNCNTQYNHRKAKSKAKSSLLDLFTCAVHCAQMLHNTAQNRPDHCSDDDKLYYITLKICIWLSLYRTLNWREGQEQKWGMEMGIESRGKADEESRKKEKIGLIELQLYLPLDTKTDVLPIQ